MAGGRRKQGRAVAFLNDSSWAVRVALLRHLSPKWILRMRAVCVVWRDVLSHPALPLYLHDAAPPQVLLCFERSACPDRNIPLTSYCVESLVLLSGELRPVFRFHHNEFHGAAVDAEGRDAPPIRGSRAVDYETTTGDDYADAALKPQLVVHASLEGYLLVSFALSLYVVSPATRHWVALPDPTAFDLVGFYRHPASNQYRVLCVRGKDNEGSACYFVLTVGSPPPPWVRLVGLESGVENACVSPPIQFPAGGNLHWPPQERQGFHILVFDAVAEVFSRMSPPPVAVRDPDQDMRLLQLPHGRHGKLGLSVSMKNKATLELWSLEDYQNEDWGLLYRIQLAVHQVELAPFLNDEEDWTPAVVSPEGDVLIECTSSNWLLHCDRNGNLLRKFWFPEGSPLVVRHALRETLFWDPMFPGYRVRTAPPFFNWLFGDPTW